MLLRQVFLQFLDPGGVADVGLVGSAQSLNVLGRCVSRFRGGLRCGAKVAAEVMKLPGKDRVIRLDPSPEVRRGAAFSVSDFITASGWGFHRYPG